MAGVRPGSDNRPAGWTAGRGGSAIFRQKPRRGACAPAAREHRNIGLSRPDRQPERPAGFYARAAGFSRQFGTGWVEHPRTGSGVPAMEGARLAKPSAILTNSAVVENRNRKRGWSFTQDQTYHAPSIPLPGDFELYLSGIDKKQRHEIRRKMRRAQENGSKLRWYIVSDGATLEAEVNAFLVMMAQEPDKDKFLTEAMCQQIRLSCRAAFENGWLQLAFLEVDGQKAAGYINFDYLNRIWVYNSGIERRFMELSPGWVLLGHLLQWANENKRTEFDFMRGEEEYKYRFGGVDQVLVRAKVTR
jgi:CelD/BcsL family acetyltransferase involved in cellulose biosynthesis